VKYKIDYKNVLELTVDGIIVFDLEGYLVDVSEGFVDMIGYTKNELIGKHAADLIAVPIDYFVELDSDTIINKLRKFGFVENHETSYLKKDGSVVFAEVNISSLKDDETKTIGYITAVRVVTDSKVDELKLRESEDFLRRVIYADPAYIFVKDRNGKYAVASKPVLEYFGQTSTEIIGKTNFDFVSTGKISINDCEKLMKDDLEVINTGKELFISEESILSSDGSMKWFQTTKVPLVRGGVADHILGVGVDITERKINFELLEKKETELAYKNQSLTDLNTALRVLVDKKDEDKTELEAKVVSSLKILVEPYLGKLEACCSSTKQKNFVEILKTNLKEVISPFSLNLVSGYVDLSSSEIQVAGLIKNGLRNKEIAELINISVETVSVHRKNIRKKLRISNTKINLYSYLKTLQ
jgi:PAS domain S-box-containing protein